MARHRQDAAVQPLPAAGQRSRALASLTQRFTAATPLPERGHTCHRQTPDPGDRRSRPRRYRATYRPCRVPGQHVTGISSPDHHDGQLASAISRRRSPAVLPAPPRRRSRAQGRWSVARAPVTVPAMDRGKRCQPATESPGAAGHAQRRRPGTSRPAARLRARPRGRDPGDSPGCRGAPEASTRDRPRDRPRGRPARRRARPPGGKPRCGRCCGPPAVTWASTGSRSPPTSGPISSSRPCGGLPRRSGTGPGRFPGRGQSITLDCPSRQKPITPASSDLGELLRGLRRAGGEPDVQG